MTRLRRLCLPVLLLLPPAFASPAAAAPSARPDLAVRSVTPPGSATAGAPFTVAVRVAHRGRTPAAAVGAYLARDRVLDRSDVRLAGAGRLPATRGRPATRRIAMQVRTANAQAPGSYFVIACADDRHRIRERSERDNCAASARPLAVTATPVSSSELLATAVAAHKLSPQQALVYRVFAAFGDPRLPSAYAGDDREPDDLVMRAAAQAWPTLSAAQQLALRPFFTPPVVRGSWFSPVGSTARAAAASNPFSCRIGEPTGGWHTLAKPGGHVRLWWSNRDNARIGPRMRALLAEADGTIWPRLHALMGREPLADANVACFNGGDAKLDVYMVGRGFHAYAEDPHAIAATINYPGRCSPAPVFIVVDVSHGAPARSTLAHELMHAFQFAFRFRDACDTYSAWDEATATWAMQYVYPHDDDEHQFAPWYPESALPKTAYRGWLFPFALEQLHGAQTIGAIYGQAERLPVAQAIDAGIPGGLAQAWPEFALKAWNDEAVAPSFKQWDNFDQQPLEPYTHQPVPTEQLGVMPAAEPEHVPRLLARLTRDYHHFTFAQNVTSVSISQPPAPGIRVDAIERFGDGTTHVEQLPASRMFCSADPAKRLTDLVLVITNSALTAGALPAGTLPAPLELLATDDTCGPARYRVLGASITTHATASTPGAACAGGTSGSTTISGASTDPQPDDDSNQLAPIDPGGPLSGQIYAKTAARISAHASGCGGQPTKPCSVGYDNAPYPGDVGFTITAQDPASGQATLQWSLLDPAVGFHDDFSCYVVIEGHVPSEAATQTVPLAKLLSSDPQTFTLSGSTHLDHDIAGRVASIDYDWSLSLTVQRR